MAKKRIRPTSKSYGLTTINYIKSRIAVPRTEEENQSNFIVRELAQNADDVKAKSLVLRFQSDALYAANDGDPFEVINYDAIMDILSGTKEFDKDTTGNFGSGFVTVFRLTNHPEIHSNGNSIVIDPVRQKWFEHDDKNCPINFDSHDTPFDDTKDKNGVLFRFPWRKLRQAEEAYAPIEESSESEIMPFINSNDWPRWDKQIIREIYDDLKKYIHDVLLCCQHLERITLVWSYKEQESFQVVRDFTLTRMLDEIGSVKEGNCCHIKKFSTSFRELKWQGNPKKYSYYIIHDYVRKNGKQLHIFKRRNNEVDIGYVVPGTAQEIRRNNVVLLFPLYDFDERVSNASTVYKYATIPLPGRTPNKFIFSGHFFPMEDRKGVDVMGHGGKTKQWYMAIMRTIAYLFKEKFSDQLEHVMHLDIEDREKQKITLNSLPGAPISEWMRTEANIAEWEELDQLIVDTINSENWILFDGDWYNIDISYVVDSDLEYDVVTVFNSIPIWNGKKDERSGDIVNHTNYEKYLHTILTEDRFTEDYFEACMNEFSPSSYGFDDPDTKGISKDELELLLKYCESKKTDSDFRLIPDAGGILRKKGEFRIFPNDIRDVVGSIIPIHHLIHEDFRSDSQNIQNTNNEEILEYIDEKYRELANGVDLDEIDEKSHPMIDEEFHKALSKVLHYLYKVKGFHLSILGNYFFIPYEKDNCIRLGKPNTTDKGIRGEKYQRDWIFGSKTDNVPGLSDRVKDKIKLFSIIFSDDKYLSDLEKELGILGLIDRRKRKDGPTNFVRHFITNKYGSLFDDAVLADFLKIDGMKNKNKTIQKEKLILLDALPVYFTRKKTESGTGVDRQSMSMVPCLYDQQGNWFPAGDFCISSTPELEFHKYKTLDERFLVWGDDTLYALGAEIKPTLEVMLDTITETVKKKKLAKDDRRGLVDTFLHLVLHERGYNNYSVEFNEIKWVPVRDGSLSRPQDAYWPSSYNLEILGDSYPQLLDIRVATPSVLASYKTTNNLGIETDAALKANVTELGIKASAEHSVLIDIIELCMTNGTAPPPKIFLEIAKHFEENQLMDYHLGYYHDGNWHESQHFVIVEDKEKFDSFLSKIVIPFDEDKHKKYLRCIGVKDYIKPAQILFYLDTHKDTIMDDWPLFNQLWNIIEQWYESLQLEDIQEYSSRSIYLIDNQYVCPEDMILFDMDIDSINIGNNQYAVSKNTIKNHELALKEFGARHENNIGDDIDDIIESFIDHYDEKDVNDAEYGVFMELLRIAKENDAVIPDLKLLGKDGDYYNFISAEACYIDDDSRSKLFLDSLYILDPNFPIELHDFVMKHGTKSTEKSIKIIRTNIRPSETREYADQEIRLRMMGDALQHKYGHPFEWLQNITVKQTDFLEVVYSLSNEERSSNEQAYTSFQDDDSPIFITFPATNELFKELTKLICRKNSDTIEGYTDEEFNEFEFIIAHMLRTNPIEWTNHIAGYVPTTTDILPFDVVYLERPEYRQGYAKTRQYFRSCYSGCQICGDPTPLSKGPHPETCESVNAIVSKMGGFVNDDPGNYEIGGCLYLCPRHQVIMKRGLIGIPSLATAFNFRKKKITENARIKEVKKHLAKAKSGIDFQKEYEQINCDVWQINPATSEYEDVRLEMDITPKHYNEMLEWIQKYLVEHLARMN